MQSLLYWKSGPALLVVKTKNISTLLLKLLLYYTILNCFIILFPRLFLLSIFHLLFNITNVFFVTTRTLFNFKLSFLSFWSFALPLSFFTSHEYLVNSESPHYMKSVQIRSFFWSVFSGIRTEYGVFSPNAGKYGSEKTPYLDSFDTVPVSPILFLHTYLPRQCFIWWFFSSSYFFE